MLGPDLHFGKITLFCENRIIEQQEGDETSEEQGLRTSEGD